MEGRVDSDILENFQPAKPPYTLTALFDFVLRKGRAEGDKIIFIQADTVVPHDKAGDRRAVIFKRGAKHIDINAALFRQTVVTETLIDSVQGIADRLE